ncbi:MAG: TonB-dependent receptor, partial [Pseudomonadota bacterium]
MKTRNPLLALSASTTVLALVSGASAAHAAERHGAGSDPMTAAPAGDTKDAASEPIDNAPDKAGDYSIDPSLLEAPLEDLLVREATSVAKKRQKVQDSAAAVYVITQEDIRNSPAATVVDLLRTVPGVEVGALGNAATAVTIRGFNGRNANSLLVMIDGRSIYVSTLSGVFWDQLMLPLSDIERIEVVRGPGATLWGANAVNGVINIITKNSADTLGFNALARASARRQELSLSKGARVTDGLTVRLHGTYQRDEQFVDEDGNDISGSARTGGELGVRADWQVSPKDAITLQADYSGAGFDNLVDQPNLDPPDIALERIMPEERFEQFNILARWSHEASDTLRWRAQAYYTYLERTELGLASYEFEIADLDLGVNWAASDTHDLSIGLGARLIADEGTSTRTGTADFGELGDDVILSGYIQDDIRLIPDRLNLTIGAKLEHNDFTGFEFQPSARVFYRPKKALGLWGSVSRAVRTPSRFERGSDLSLQFLPPNSAANPSALPVIGTLIGNPDLESEKLTALEAGVRYDFAPGWNIDLASYYNFYESVVTPTEVGSPFITFPPSPLPVAFELITEPQNRGSLRTWGLEANLSGQVTVWWSTRASYSNFNFEKDIDPLTGEPYSVLLTLSTSPEHQASWTNTFDLATSVQLSTQLRYVS